MRVANYTNLVKTITVEHLRQNWPEVEKSLQQENEIIITRDSKPVAKLVGLVEKTSVRKRWDPEKHLARINKITGGKIFPSIDDRIAEDREDR